jgi:predicted component of type VI protein secretion system
MSFTVTDAIRLAHDIPVHEFVDQLGTLVLIGSPLRSDAVEAPWSFSTSTNLRPYRSTGMVMAVMGRDHLVHPLRKAKPGAFADTVLVGRASSNDITIDDPSVSKLHARIQLRPGEPALLVDASSHNGTFKDEHPVHTESGTPIGHRDELRFGQRVFIAFDTVRLHAQLLAMPESPP